MWENIIKDKVYTEIADIPHSHLLFAVHKNRARNSIFVNYISDWVRWSSINDKYHTRAKQAQRFLTGAIGMRKILSRLMDNNLKILNKNGLAINEDKISVEYWKRK